MLLYYYLRYGKQAIGTLKNSLGWGDVIIVCYFMMFLPSLFFIFFMQISIVLSLLLYLITKKKSSRKEIPFAAYISLFYVFVSISDLITTEEIINDLLFLKWLKLF
jgi:dolichyl-phosphate-mannose--protein O-mannosyl transferase